MFLNSLGCAWGDFWVSLRGLWFVNGQSKAAISVELFGSVLRILEKQMGNGNFPLRKIVWKDICMAFQKKSFAISSWLFSQVAWLPENLSFFRRRKQIQLAWTLKSVVWKSCRTKKEQSYHRSVSMSIWLSLSLGGGFKLRLYFHPKKWGWSQFDSYFFRLKQTTWIDLDFNLMWSWWHDNVSHRL